MASAQERRAQTLKELLEAVRRLTVEMLERRMPLADALEACGAELCARTAVQMRMGATPAQAYARSIGAFRERGGRLDSLDEEDMTALKRLFDHLGEGGVQTQRLVLREAEEELERLSERARSRHQEYGRLYTSLGGLAGIAVALMMM